MATIDYIHGNYQASGSVAARLLKNKMDMDVLRPFIGRDGRSYVTVVTDEIDPKTDKPVKRAVPTHNATLLKRDDWLTIDEEVLSEARPLLRLVGDLRSRGLTLDIDGMANPILMYQTVGRITGATISMDGLREGEKDRPEFDSAFHPLPIIHKDCSFSMRQVVAAQRHGTPFDRITLQLAAQEVATDAEKLLLGTLGSYAYGGGTVYGYTNHPSRATKTLTLPTAAGWTPETTVNEVIAMRTTLRENLKPGPFVLYISPGWEPYLDQDYSAAYGNTTLRERLGRVGRIETIESVDYLSDYQMLLVSMDRGTVREIIGMDVKTIQWESPDGMEMYFKVLCILVPQFRFDQTGRAGVVHGTAA